MNAYSLSVRVIGDRNSPAGFGGLWPTSEDRVTSPFGMRTHPVTGKRTMHNGIDIGTYRRIGEPVFAPVAGVISWSSSKAGGLQMAVSSGNRSYTFCHLSKRLAPDKSSVSMGDIIALTGNTGASSGPHLHMGVWDTDGAGSKPVDPLSMWWLKIDGLQQRDDPTSPTVPESAALPRGLRNNNPLNVRKNVNNDWLGVVRPGSDPAFEQFSDMTYGARCGLYLLRKYIRGGHNTIAKIIARWAPETENNTQGYITEVERRSGVPRDRVINPDDAAEVIPIFLAMTEVENGRPLPDISTAYAAWDML